MDNKLKPISQVAKELNITVQTVYRKIDNLDLQKLNYVKKINNKKYITDEGFNIIKQSLTAFNTELNDAKVENQPKEDINNIMLNNVKTEELNTVKQSLNDINTELNDVKQEYINHLKEELRKKDEQITKLIDSNNQLTAEMVNITKISQELTRNSQILLKEKAETPPVAITEEKSYETKKNIFQKIFKRGE